MMLLRALAIAWASPLAVINDKPPTMIMITAAIPMMIDKMIIVTPIALMIGFSPGVPGVPNSYRVRAIATLNDSAIAHREDIDSRHLGAQTDHERQ